jgi:hypothetical protein
MSGRCGIVLKPEQVIERRLKDPADAEGRLQERIAVRA